MSEKAVMKAEICMPVFSADFVNMKAEVFCVCIDLERFIQQTYWLYTNLKRFSTIGRREMFIK